MDDLKDHVRAVGYALEALFNDALGEEEMQESLEDMIEQWKGNSEYARRLKADWDRVLAEKDGNIAQVLVLKWARQGKRSQEEALVQLADWHRQLDPLWSEL